MENDAKKSERLELLKIGSGLLSGKNSKIGNVSAIILLFLAAIADLLCLIPFVGDVVGPVFWIAVAIYLWKIGCGFINPRRLITEVISMIAELIPGVQELPTIIVGVAIIILLVRFEDQTGLSVMKPLSAGGKLPLNQNGVRLPPPRQPANRNVNGTNMRLPQGNASTRSDLVQNKKARPDIKPPQFGGESPDWRSEELGLSA
ncbi:MAG: hypothetical protein KGJ35_02255 [Patescibacteria group bacterium]|nr:hypothetical protein [Patescibacteria group bacterium]